MPTTAKTERLEARVAPDVRGLLVQAAAIAVDAIDDQAGQFYERQGFLQLPVQDRLRPAMILPIPVKR